MGAQRTPLGGPVGISVGPLASQGAISGCPVGLEEPRGGLRSPVCILRLPRRFLQVLRGPPRALIGAIMSFVGIFRLPRRPFQALRAPLRHSEGPSGSQTVHRGWSVGIFMLASSSHQTLRGPLGSYKGPYSVLRGPGSQERVLSGCSGPL